VGKTMPETAKYDFWYPGVGAGPGYLTVGLVDVRAADEIRIHYDYDRDGWSIEQASIFSWDVDDAVCDPDWQEVAFVEAWGRQRPEDTP